MKPLLPCLDCGALGPWRNNHGIRCRRCERIREGERAAAYRPLPPIPNGARCARCKTGGGLTWDHKTPLSRGGTNEPSNLQVLCRRCNSGKRDRRVDD